jgi:hypothetical protein
MNEQDLKKEIEKLTEFEVEIEAFSGTNNLIQFFKVSDDGHSGVYNIGLKRIILIHNNSCSDIQYNVDFNLIEYYSYRTEGKIWIDVYGDQILKGGEIIQELSNGCYHIEKDEENFDKTFIHTRKYLYCPEPESQNIDIENFNKFLIANVDVITPTETGNIILVQTNEYNKIKKIGVYDLRNFTWIHELKEYHTL